MLLTIVFILIGLAVGFSVKMMFFRPDGARGVVAFFLASLFWLIAAPAIPASRMRGKRIPVIIISVVADQSPV